MTKIKQTSWQSFKVAFAGLVYFFTTDLHGKVHLGIAIIVSILAGLYHLSQTEWLLIILCIAAVICLEITNAVIERLCDMIQPLTDPNIKIIKDMAAGAVLLMSLASLIVGLVIFIPKL